VLWVVSPVDGVNTLTRKMKLVVVIEEFSRDFKHATAYNP